jgi:type I site-specific restriction endonuclease
MYAQMVGRGTRLSPDTGKTDLLIHDFLWMSEKHALAHPASLIAEDEEIEKRMVEKAKAGGKVNIGALEEQAHSDAKAEREDVLKRYIDANAHRKSKTVDPLVFGFLTDNEEITHYEATFAWESAPATENQRRALEKFGFDGSQMKRGYASKILDGLIQRCDKKLASAKQIALLSKHGYRRFENMTFTEASVCIDKLA